VQIVITSFVNYPCVWSRNAETSAMLFLYQALKPWLGKLYGKHHSRTWSKN
jgi:hypothetical protein